MAKAHDGNLGALKKLGVGIDENIIKSKNFDAATAALAATFEGQATKQAETFQGKMARLTVAFDEAKETVGSYVLDAITPLISTFVDKGIPVIQDVAKNLGETLGPAFSQIFKFIKDDLLPILVEWWKFLYTEVIPAIGRVVGPVLEGLKNAFDTIKKSIENNSEELKPFIEFLKTLWKFISEYLAPLLGGAFKVAIEGIATLIGGLVTAFGKFVTLINNVYNAAKKVIDLIRNNPIVDFFQGDNSKSLKVSGSFPTETPTAGGFDVGSAFSPTATSTLMPSSSLEAAIARREELKAETARLRAEREANAAARANITVNMGVVGDPESAARTIVDVLNKSQARGTGGAGLLIA